MYLQKIATELIPVNHEIAKEQFLLPFGKYSNKSKSSPRSSSLTRTDDDLVVQGGNFTIILIIMRGYFVPM